MSADYKFRYFIDWLQRSSPDVHCLKLSYTHDNFKAIEACDGIVMTGGGDVSPQLYNGPANHPKLDGVDPKRDTFERKVIEYALKEQLPLLGVCRGMQLVNVHFGGTLMPDIEEAGYRSHRGTKEHECRHIVQVSNSVLLASTVAMVTGEVNSSHHQAVLDPGSGLTIVARTSDGIPEAMEWNEARQFFLLLQWHPERMNDHGNPFSSSIAGRFIQAAGQSLQSKHLIKDNDSGN